MFVQKQEPYVFKSPACFDINYQGEKNETTIHDETMEQRIPCVIHTRSHHSFYSSNHPGSLYTTTGDTDESMDDTLLP